MFGIRLWIKESLFNRLSYASHYLNSFRFFLSWGLEQQVLSPHQPESLVFFRLICRQLGQVWNPKTNHADKPLGCLEVERTLQLSHSFQTKKYEKSANLGNTEKKINSKIATSFETPNWNFCASNCSAEAAEAIFVPQRNEIVIWGD